eukprot:Nk52_evm3s234 gene=Nk52_evmTU3s234
MTFPRSFFILCLSILVLHSILVTAKPTVSASKEQPNDHGVKGALQALASGVPSIRLAAAKGESLDPVRLEKRWYSYDTGTDELKFRSPWNENLTEDNISTPDSVNQFSFAYDEETFTKSLQQKIDVKGNFVAVSGENSLDILNSMSSKTEKIQMDALIKNGHYTKHIWNSISKYKENPEGLLSDKAYEMIQKEDWQRFFDTYGTHFIVSKEYGCIAHLTGVYEFKNSEEKNSFKDKVSASLKYGSFSVSTSTSIEKLATDTSKESKLEVSATGDYVSLLKVSDPTTLSGWASAFFSSYGALCETPVLKSVSLVSWADFLSNVKGGLVVTDTTLQLISRGVMAQSIAISGYERMFRHLTNLPESYAKDGSILMKPLWTDGIEIGKTCDGTATLSGPPHNLTKFRDEKIQSLKSKKWLTDDWSKNSLLNPEAKAKAFMEDMQTALAEYTTLNRHYTPSFEVQAKVGMSGFPQDPKTPKAAIVSKQIDVFNKPDRFSLYTMDMSRRNPNDGYTLPNWLPYRLGGALIRGFINVTHFKEYQPPGQDWKTLAFQPGAGNQFISWECPGNDWDNQAASSPSECPSGDTDYSYYCKIVKETMPSTFAMNYVGDARYAFTVVMGQTGYKNFYMDLDTKCFDALSIEFSIIPIAEEKDRFGSAKGYFPLSCDAATRFHKRPPKNWPNKGKVEFEDVVISYAHNLPPVIKGISFTVKGGQKVGIVGRAGAGKSTIALAIFRFMEASKGHIKIDGVEVSKIGLTDLRAGISIIPEDPVLFTGSIRSNLDPLNERTDLQMWAALDAVELGPYVRSLDGQLDYEITENAVNISSGQRQLMALARALMKKSNLLVMDEATANVDVETDDLIQATIRKRFAKSTVITIAHRLRTIIDYDRVLVLDSGRVAEYDNPKNLLEMEDSIFKSMYKNCGQYNALAAKVS